MYLSCIIYNIGTQFHQFISQESSLMVDFKKGSIEITVTIIYSIRK